MPYNKMTEDEAAAMVKDGETLALSGFTPNGNPLGFFRALSKRAVKLHEAGEPFIKLPNDNNTLFWAYCPLIFRSHGLTS